MGEITDLYHDVIRCGSTLTLAIVTTDCLDLVINVSRYEPALIFPTRGNEALLGKNSMPIATMSKRICRQLPRPQ